MCDNFRSKNYLVFLGIFRKFGKKLQDNKAGGGRSTPVWKKSKKSYEFTGVGYGRTLACLKMLAKKEY